MAMCLSFTEEFFTGTGEHDLDSMPPSERPTSVLQAIISLDPETQRAIARDILKVPGQRSQVNAYIESESFPFDVLDRVRETDTCDGCVSPVQVWIDPDRNYTLTVYE